MSLWPNMMKPRNWDDITLSFAAIVQLCEQIHLLAHGQTTDPQVQATGMQSLFVFNPDNTTQVFGDISNVSRGLTWLANLSTHKANAGDRDMLQYLTAVLYLMRLVLKDKPRLAKLHQRLQVAKNQVDYFHELHPQVLAGIADIYIDTTSHLSFRVQVRGLKQVLTQATSMQVVRCLLLASLRAAVLWHQVGGRRWQLLFARQRMANTAKKLLSTIQIQ